ncbi:hypothetical protein RSAG8_07530, partial [Rhizoctonia solani AG-8 WAC10335]
MSEPDPYMCISCPYSTQDHRAFRVHIVQCSAFIQTTRANEFILARKRKRKSQDHSSGSNTTEYHCRASKLPHTGTCINTNIITHEAVKHNISSLPPPQYEIEPTQDGSSTVLNGGFVPVVCAPEISAAGLSYPGYQPVLGQLRDQHDNLPEAPPALLDQEKSPPAPQIRRIILRVRPVPPPFTTTLDSFGQYRVYLSKPLTIPDSACELEDFSDIQSRPSKSSVADGISPGSISSLIAPCPNISAFRLQHWHWNEGHKKSRSARESLIRDVITQPDFVPSDVSNVDWRRLDNSLALFALDNNLEHKQTSVPLPIPPRTPAAAASYKLNPTQNVLSIPTTSCQSLLGAVKRAFTKNNQHFFHYEPYNAYFRDPKTSKSYQVFGEAYESQRMLDMHQQVQRVPLDEPCDLPRCVAALMLFSDAMQLTLFGKAKIWPIRATFGNISKYERCKPNSENHYDCPMIYTTHIRKLEDGRTIPKALLTHLRRELFHQVWKHILNDEFLHAWRHGVVVHCADGITRRVFPRIFSYSADYPEKVLIATLRGLRSLRPCPRCLIPQSQFIYMGLPSDMHRRQALKRIDTKERNDRVREARSIIYDEGRAITSSRVEGLLRSVSYVPTNNAFSRRLRTLGFDIFEALTVDLLHEIELGVWKSVFQHLLRILESTGSKTMATFNERFRLISSFGDGTIRPFSEDVSSMSRPAARNYEDILQCIIPAVEGLLPSSIESQVLTLLFVLAHWHGLAKLRRHTTATVDALRHATTRLGHELREFHRYTSELDIYETTKEHAARQQRLRKKARPRAALAIEPDEPDEPDPTANSPYQSRCRKYFNLETVKLHVVGDYPESIERFGTTDSTSTQTGELLHRHGKRRTGRTNGKKYARQMDRIQRIESRLSDIKQDIAKFEQSDITKSESTTVSTLAHEELPSNEAGRAPYQIASSQKNQILLPLWLGTHRTDPAVKDFLPRLRSHLLARLEGGRYEDEVTRSSSELVKIQFQHDRIYAHQTLKIHYTTYDMRRNQDTINSSTSKCFILVASDASTCSDMGANRFWYAKVLGIYHANVSHDGSRPRRMDFLWVRWLARMVDVPGGWDTCRLDQVGYFPDSEHHHAFEFVDPADIIRAVHLIPRFVGKQTTEYLEPVSSLATDSQFGDWKHYYVGRFVDRDMLMRFIGMAIGHLTHEDVPETAVGIPDEALGMDYEYTNDPAHEQTDLCQEINNEMDGEEQLGDEEDDENESDLDISDTDEVCIGEDGELIEEIDEEVSW